MSAAQADQEARRAAEMVLAILGERVDHVEGTGEVRPGGARRLGVVCGAATTADALRPYSLSTAQGQGRYVLTAPYE
jgi:hypothetical protein